MDRSKVLSNTFIIFLYKFIKTCKTEIFVLSFYIIILSIYK